MPIASGPPPDTRAEDIFFRTRAAFGARAFPPTMRYSIRISGLKDGKWAGRTYDAHEEWPEGRLFVDSISEEETANPVRTSGISLFGLDVPPKKGLELPGILGLPKLAITYAFGLGFKPAAASPSDTSDTTDTLKTVGSVRVESRVYDVRLAGEERIDGYPCFHLTLAPLGNPGRYRLRDLWVDEANYQTRQLVTDGNFTLKETGSGKWTVSYKQIGDSWYLADELSQGTVDDGAGTFDHVDVQFFNVATDPHDNLDFGISSAPNDEEVIEPADTLR
jgi:hypothetical protein